MTSLTLAYIIAALIWAALIAYAVLGGADFGGGVWTLLAQGPQPDRQRRLIAQAIGPVWEANNVWLIYVIVATFTAFPIVYSAVSTALFIPVTLALIGIVLRGAAFGFSAHFRAAEPVGVAWARVFSVASTITPFLLGTIAGALASGKIRVHADGTVSASYWATWTTPFALSCGLFAVALCAVLAATYLTVEARSRGDDVLESQFRLKALAAGAVAALLGAIAALLGRAEGLRLWAGLVGHALPLSLGAVLIGLATAWALLFAHVRLARVLVALETAGILAAWGVAQAPYLIVPDVTVASAAASQATLVALLVGTIVGMALLLPSLWWLFAVFKGRNLVPGMRTRSEGASPSPPGASRHQ